MASSKGIVPAGAGKTAASSGSAMVKSGTYEGPKFLGTFIDQGMGIKEIISSLGEALEANLGVDATIKDRDLIRVKTPSGGGLSWEVPGLDAEPESTKDIQGVILFSTNKRAFWKTSFDEAPNTPPSCTSDDAKTGTGFIYGEPEKDADGKALVPHTRSCAKCPMSQWGSGDFDSDGKRKMKGGKPLETNSQACVQRKLVFVMRPGDAMPIVLDLAPTSIKLFEQFMMKLAVTGTPCHSIVCSFTLRKEKSSGGVDYSEVVVSKIATLDKDQRELMGQYARLMRPKMDRVAAAFYDQQNAVQTATVNGRVPVQNTASSDDAPSGEGEASQNDRPDLAGDTN